MMRIRIFLPDQLLSEIDGHVCPGGRNEFLIRAATNELKRERLRSALDVARGALVGTPGLRSGEEIIRFVDGLRPDDRDRSSPVTRQ